MLKQARTRSSIYLIVLAVFSFAWLITPTQVTAQTTQTATSSSEVATSTDTLNQQITQKSQELTALNNQIAAAQAQIDAVNKQKNTLNNNITSLNYTINRLELSIKANELQAQELSLELQGLDAQLTQTEDAITNGQAAIAEILRELQTSDNNQDLLAIILRNGDLSDSVQQLQNLQNLKDKLRENIDNMTSLSSSLSQTIDTTNQKKASIDLAYKNATNQQLIILDEKSQKATLLQQTKDSESAYQAQLTSLNMQRDQIGQEILDLESKLRANFNSNVLPPSIPGTLSYPVTNVVITQGYGATKFAEEAYATHFHNGVDLGVPIGTPVFAADDGIIYAVGNNGRLQYGKYIMIKHPDNLATIYAHLSRQIVTVGQQVKRGDLIGYSGETGDATGPHVHFGVYWAPSVSLKYFAAAGMVPIGVTVNPMNYLP